MWKNETSSNFFRKTKKKLSQGVRSQVLNQQVTTSLIWGETTEIIIYPFSRRACSFTSDWMMLLMKEILYYPAYPQNPTENGSIIVPTGSLNNMVSIMLVKAHVWANLSNVSRFFKNQATYPRAPSADSGIATKLVALQCSWASDNNMRGFVNKRSGNLTKDGSPVQRWSSKILRHQTGCPSENLRTPYRREWHILHRHSARLA